MTILQMAILEEYGEPGERGTAAHQFTLHRVEPKGLPTGTVALLEKEWLFIRNDFTHDMRVPFYEGLTSDGARVSARPFRYAAVFNHNWRRPGTIEPLYASHAFVQFGELLIPVTSEGTFVYARKINQKGQFSGFGGHIDMDKHHQKTINLQEAMQPILKNELGPLGELVNMRVLGVDFVDQTFKRGMEVCLSAESKHSESEWQASFPQSAQFSRELLFIEPTADALIDAIVTAKDAEKPFSPSAIVATYLALRALTGAKDAGRFADGIRAAGYPLKTP